MFSQVVDFVPRHTFRRRVERYRGDYGVRSFRCWQQFLGQGARGARRRQFDLSLIASFAIGGYSFALSAASGVPQWLAVLVGGTLGGASTLLVIPIQARLNPEHQAAVSMAYILALRELSSEWGKAGGATGLSVQPGKALPVFLGSVAYAAIGIYTYYQVQRSPLGRAAVCERENALFLQALGVSPPRIRGRILLFQGLLASFGGVFYCSSIGYFSPREFDITAALLILMVVMMGGMEEIWSVVLGGIVISGCSEFFLRYGSLNRLLVGLAFLAFTFLYSAKNRVGVPYEYSRPFLRG